MNVFTHSTNNEMKELLTVLDRAMYRLDDLIRKDAAVDKVARVKAKELAILERVAVSRARFKELDRLEKWKNVNRQTQLKHDRKVYKGRVMRSTMHTLLVNELARLGREGVTNQDLEALK